MNPPPRQLPLLRLLICASLILSLAMGIRHGFGLWLQPVTQTQGWTRETFSLAIAVQNLSWGLFGIFSGMLADRWGGWRVVIGGSLLWVLGLSGMALSDTPLLFILSTGVVIGAAQSASTYGVIYGIIGRQLAPERRSWAMGLTGAAGSFGQFLMMPLDGWLIGTIGWQQALLLLAAATLLIGPLALLLREPVPARSAATPAQQQGVLQALGEAAGYRSFQLLMAAYFVCGFQVTFIGVHLPSYLKDQGLSPQVASTALALIGLLNILGTYGVGVLGQRWPNRFLLATIYGARAVAITIFLLLPLTTWSVYAFAAFMGLLWLSTVPPTSATVAQIFGVRHFSMLSGFVFCSHQLGSFMGVWLGGWLYDHNGNYNLVWIISIVLGVIAAAISLPVRETPIERMPHRIAESTAS
jgi:MFS family permease